MIGWYNELIGKCIVDTTREFVTGLTVLQHKTVEHFSKKGRVEAVNLRHKSVEGLLLSRFFSQLANLTWLAKSFIVTAPNI